MRRIARGLPLPFKRSAVPVAKRRGAFIGALAKLQQCGRGRLRLPHIVVHQKEFAELPVVRGGVRTDTLVFESLRLGCRVGVERRTLDVAARPEAHTAYFVGVGFPSYGIRAGSLRGSAAGKPGNRQIKTSPEEVYRAGLADESGSELVENRVHG